MKHVEIRVSGQVQGVGFRYFTQTMARQIGIYGFVRNEYDGSVYIDAEGEKVKLDLFIDYIKKGPTYSQVSRLNLTELDTCIGYSRFDIRY